MNRALACLGLLLASLLCGASPGRADERITHYQADIQIAADGSMSVSEHIGVIAEGRDIRRGIYRDFPTDYRDRQHNRYQVGFEVLGATRDGDPEKWHSERRGNGVRVYLGDKNHLLSHGEHRYTLRYRTTRQLGFFDDHDELYWNVTGSDWAFPITQAGATIHLPSEVPSERLKAYGHTGSTGSRAHALRTRIRADGARYATTAALAPHQNLTVVLEFPKGIVAAPDARQKAHWLLEDNRNLLLALLGLALLWLYYGWAWNRHGRDPASGPLVARYEPPDGDSAAALRYVRDMGYDNTCFTAGVLGLAARGRLEIRQDKNEDYTLSKASDPPADTLPADASALYKSLFAASDPLLLVQSNHTRVSQARKAHQNALALAYEKKYFFTNSTRLIPGVVISLATLVAMLQGAQQGAWFMLLWLTIWSVGVFTMLSAAISGSHRKGFGNLFRSLVAWLVAVPFLIGEVVGLGMFGHLVGYAVLPVFIALLGTNFAFYHWMKAPTQDGARLLDGIEGFRWYLGVAEKQELDSRYKPESHPELFARYLPYALALDVGNAWSERFARALTPAQMHQAQPVWYSGSSIGALNAGNFASFSSDLSSGVTGAISSAATAPGSSSGSGGFSGGGGGGGGGGGW